MSKYIEFEVSEVKKKTTVFNIKKKDTLFSLGKIKWFGAWRKYCFFPEEEVVFDVDCLKTIILFIEKIMKERDIERAKKKNIRIIERV